ncbi:unnamed protein product, partial [Pylaiella littoralis]
MCDVHVHHTHHCLRSRGMYTSIYGCPVLLAAVCGAAYFFVLLGGKRAGWLTHSLTHSLSEHSSPRWDTMDPSVHSIPGLDMYRPAKYYSIIFFVSRARAREGFR